ncbi:MAG: hypothetical protein QF570_22150 [Myxococcota bacterium]|nr:hypothetical protein [Myxococcota bacterium]
MPTQKRDRSTTQPAHRTARTRWRPSGRLVIATGLVAVALTAGTAQAGGEFEDAFEAELGRITAQHFATLGQLVFFGGHPPPVARVERVHVIERHVAKPHRHGPRCGHHVRRHYRHVHRPWRPHARPHWRAHHGPRGHWKHHPHHRGHGHGHDHRYRGHGRRHGRHGDAYTHDDGGRRNHHGHREQGHRHDRRDRRQRDHHA